MHPWIAGRLVAQRQEEQISRARRASLRRRARQGERRRWSTGSAGGRGTVTGAPVDVAERLSSFVDHWSPQVVGRLNDYDVKVVKVFGESAWHTHQDTDELFVVTRGELTIQLRHGAVTLRPGQLFVVPRGLEHCPRARGEAHAVLIEPRGVVSTGHGSEHCA